MNDETAGRVQLFENNKVPTSEKPSENEKLLPTIANEIKVIYIMRVKQFVHSFVRGRARVGKTSIKKK